MLCDNECDRDFERFTLPALQRLGELFVGKTGIFDHDPKGKNQMARIYAARVEQDSHRGTAHGEPYTCLMADAYMVRCPKNEDLILEIDAGIKKEVSVGCGVASITCSICGADRKGKGCTHRPGKEYAGKGVCCNILDNPVDAYEWSFVAVPAQPAAGVVKQFQPLRKGGEPVIGIEAIAKMLAGGGEITLDAMQAQALVKHLDALRTEAELGQRYLEELRREVVSLGALASPSLRPETLAKVAHALEEPELRELKKAFEKEERLPLPQLAHPKEPHPAQNTEFQI